MQVQDKSASLVHEWLAIQKDIYIYAPDVLNGAAWNIHNIDILIKAYDESPVRLILLSCKDSESRNYNKITSNSFRELRTEMAGYIQIDVIEKAKIQKVNYIPIVSKADINMHEIGLNWIPQGDLKNDILKYVKYAILQNNRNRSIVLVWLRWTDTNRYALFNWKIGK